MPANARNNAFSFTTPNRRDFLKIGGFTAAAITLASCGGPAVGDDTGGNAGAESDVDWGSITPATEITWWSNHPGNTIELEQSYAQAFEAETGIKVNLVTAGAGYDEVAQRFQAASGTNDVPDLVIASDVWWFRYFVNGQILAIDDVFAHLGVKVDDYVSTLRGDYEYGGQHWAAPYARSTPLFYYNKDVWAKAGLPDRGPQTWAELEEWAPKLREVLPADGAPLGLSVGTSWSAWWFSNIIWGRGGGMSDEWTVTLDTPEAIEAGNYVRDMYNGANKFAALSAEMSQDFAAGLYGCMIGSTGSLNGLLGSAQFELGAAYLPDGPVAAKNVPTGGTGLAISSKATPERQLAAAMFLAFLTDTENTATFSAATGYMPVRTSAIEGETMGKLYEEVPLFRTSVDQLQEKTRVQDYVRVFTPGGDRILTEGLERIVLNGENAEDVFPQVTTELDAAFAENVEPYL